MSSSSSRFVEAWRFRWWPCVAALLLSASLLPASQVRSVNLEEMAQRAATIFAGRCVEVSVISDPAVGRPVTLATFEVDRTVKGEPGETVTIRLLGGTPRGGVTRTEVAGLPRFRAGEEVVLFLYGENRLGLSSPVGLGQGKFSLFEDKQERKIAVNEFGNRNLLSRLSPVARRRLGSRIQGLAQSPQALEPSVLLDMVEALEPRAGQGNATAPGE